MPTTIINNITMTIFKYDPNNTEGKYPDAMVVEGAELKKGDKIVATDIVDLYDTDINNPVDQQALTYVGDKWINGEVTGGGNGCNVFVGYIHPFDSNVIDVCCGKYHTLMVQEDGTLWATGRNNYGQLGLGDDITRELFTQVGTDTDWIKVRCGYDYTFAIKEDGTLWATGLNEYGQLGLGDETDRDVFTQVGTDTDWKTMAGTFRNSLAIKENGTLWGTGSNYYGQLGFGYYGSNINIFEQLTDYTNCKKVCCPYDGSMVLREDGTIWGTGNNYEGQLGINNEFHDWLFIQERTYSDTWVDLASHDEHSLAIKEDGTLWGTGSNNKGQLGVGYHYPSSEIFIQEVTYREDWESCYCGVKFSFAITKSKDLYRAGENHDGQLGLGDTHDESNFITMYSTNKHYLASCGYEHSFIINELYSLYSTGNNDYGQLGFGDRDHKKSFIEIGQSHNSLYIDQNTTNPGKGQYNTPFQSIQDAFQWLRNTCVVIPDAIDFKIKLLSDIINTEQTSLNCSQGHTIVIEGNGHSITNDYNIEVDNDNNILGNEPKSLLSYNNSLSLKDIEFMISHNGYSVEEKYFTKLSAVSNNTSRCILDDGSIWSAGYNQNGELGIGTNTQFESFFEQEIGLDNDWIFIGSSHAIKSDGTLWGTGYNYFGQLGLGDTTNRNVFTQVGTDIDWVYTNGMQSDCFAIKEDGTLWGTGYNNYGQLGLGDNNQRTYFTLVLNNCKLVDNCDYHSIAIKEDGTLWGTGYNNYGQLGLGDNDNILFFEQIGTDNDWIYISCGNFCSFGIKEDGTLWATGYNKKGKLGLGDTTNVNTFTQVGTDNDWLKLISSGDATIALKQNGTVWTSGSDINGVLAINNTDVDYYSTLFVQEYNQYDDVIDISIFNDSALIIKSDGSIWGVGYNQFGVIGDGTSGIKTVIYDHSDGGILIDGNYTERDRVDFIGATDIIHTNILNNSDMQLFNIISQESPQEDIAFSADDDKYVVTSLNKISFNFISSVGVFKIIIPHNIVIDMNSTIEIPYLDFDVVNWQAKNNSFVIINAKDIPLIDIENENSTIIVNDAKISI